MRKRTFLKITIIIITIFCRNIEVKADIYSHTITAITWTALGMQNLTGVSWTATATWPNGTYFGYDTSSSDKGQQFGSTNNPITTLNLTTSDIPGTITSVKVTTSGASGTNATVAVTVGGAVFGAKTSINSTSNLYQFIGSASGNIVISWAQTSSKAIYLKALEVTFSCNSSNLIFTNSLITKTIDDISFTQTAISLNTKAQIVYSSSATGVATVDSLTGLVTIVGVGSVNIIANQAAADNYCSTTTSYTLNITPSRTLTVTDVTNPSFTAVVGNSANQIINVSAVNLSTDLGLAISGTDAGLFSLSQYHITQTAGNIPNTLVTITYSPIVVGTHTATLTMTSTGAMDVTRLINGTATIATGLDKSPTLLFIYVENSNIKFTAESNETLDIYNSIGQKLLHSVTTEGLNTIPIPISIHGVVLVRVGSRQTKVIL